MPTVEEMKNYLRVDFDEDDPLIESLIQTAQKICMDIARIDDEETFYSLKNAKLGVLFTVAYLYEHREEADHHTLTITLRALFFADREGRF